MKFSKLQKLKKGDKVAVLSPSFAAPGAWPYIYDLGLERLRNVFGLEFVEYPSTKKIGASGEERSKDLIAAFEDVEIKAVIATLGGDDQVIYIKNLPKDPFIKNPKPFFGFSDNTHFVNHLWQCGVPSYYGGCLFTQFAMLNAMDDFTIKYLNHALFDDVTVTLEASGYCKNISFDWSDPNSINKKRPKNFCDGWFWNGNGVVSGYTWGGCLESIDEMLRHSIDLPTVDEFNNVVLCLETSEEVPSSDYVRRVLRALGERGILKRIQALLVGRAQVWTIEKPKQPEEIAQYREAQQTIILETVKQYNEELIIVQNMDFGHTDPQICLPMGQEIYIDSDDKSIKVHF